MSAWNNRPPRVQGGNGDSYPALQSGRGGGGQPNGGGRGNNNNRGQPPPRGGGGNGGGVRGNQHNGSRGSYSNGQRGGGRGGASGGADRAANEMSRMNLGGAAAATQDGQRGIRKKLTFKDRVDVCKTRPQDMNTKRGSGGTNISLVGNHFKLGQKPNWNLYNYRVDFFGEGLVEPEKRTSVKKRLLSHHRELLKLHIFDGSNLYTIDRLVQPMELASQRDDGINFVLKVVLVCEVSPSQWNYLQFFNIIMRSCFSALRFELIGRYFYDNNAIFEVQGTDLRLIPGFITNIRQHENDLMMCVEITHKVLRTKTCDEFINELSKEEAVNLLVGNVVLTQYNNKTYKIDDIQWDQTPAQSFDCKGTRITLAEYYQRQYNIRIRNMNQPLLVSRPTKRDRHRGDQANILLVPELCFPTGLLDSDRNHFPTMQALSNHLQQAPQRRANTILTFMRRLIEADAPRQILQSWGLRFENPRELMPIQNGRILQPEKLMFRTAATLKTDNPILVEKADWSRELQTSSKSYMTKCPNPLSKWVLIDQFDRRNGYGGEILVTQLIELGRGMGFPVERPVQIVQLQDVRAQAYIRAVDDCVNKYRDINFIITILPSSKNPDVYNAIKRKCLVDRGILNQCIQTRHFPQSERDPKFSKFKSIVTKLLVQLNAKIGGEPWWIQLPPELKKPKNDTMIVGFDVYHPGKGNSGSNSFGALVASLNGFVSQYYSTAFKHFNREEISTQISAQLTKCVKAFFDKNNMFPQNIVFYRDGVGEGQLDYVLNTELKGIKEELTRYCGVNNAPVPKLLFIVVTKKGNARILKYDKQQGYDNPPPGTIVDDTITLPERYDFFLIAQQARRDQTVSPTTFNVICDELVPKLSPAVVQSLTYKMCHMYFNWSGTVAVPSVCQYAHKLAFLTGSALDPTNARNQDRNLNAPGPQVAEKLLNNLYYL